MLELNFSYHSYFQIDRTITHFSLLSGSQADNSLESNMATRRHIGLKNAKNNPRNEFPISKLCKIDPLHTFQPYVFQKLIIALNPIWRPAAILDLRHFPESDWWGFLGCDYWGTKGMKSAEKPFVRIFSTLNITVGLDWLAYCCPHSSYSLHKRYRLPHFFSLTNRLHYHADQQIYTNYTQLWTITLVT